MSKPYSDPPLIEALCEFRFAGRIGVGLVYEKLRGQFPKSKQARAGLLSAARAYRQDEDLKWTEEAALSLREAAAGDGDSSWIMLLPTVELQSLLFAIVRTVGEPG